MDSLSPACTPLKTVYDSCFNLWFEGYLQPALDHAPSTSSFTVAPVRPTPTPAPAKPRIITSWSVALQRRPQTAPTYIPLPAQISEIANLPSPVAIDNTGKSRAQIKAAEYDRTCGEAWRRYQGCLKNAIADNPSLTALLDQARQEHPLGSLQGLQGTPWDASVDPRVD